MRKIFFVFLVLAILSCGILASSATNTINNTTDLNKAVDMAKTQNKSIMIVFDQKDCHYCDEMKEKTLADNKVMDKVNKSYITVIVDINEQPNLATKYKVFGTPITVFLDANQTEIGRIEGFVDANEFLNYTKSKGI